MRLRVASRAPTLALVAVLAAPASAEAHGLVQRADLPIPEWLFGWAAGIVLLVSFAALAVLWPQPRFEGPSAPSPRPLAGPLGRALAGPRVRFACGAIGAFLLAVVVWCGFADDQSPTDNLAPTLVFVAFWVGLVPASILFGDVFRAFNPWAAIARAIAAVTPRAPAARSYPEGLGRRPAALGILGFAWLELVSKAGETPRNLAIATLVYSAATWVGMARYGIDAWLDRGEAFSVYFNLFSRMSPFEARDGLLHLRRPLSGLAALDAVPGTVALLGVMIGTVTFDGFSQGGLWRGAGPDVASAFQDLGASFAWADRFAGTIGLLACVAVITGFYSLGVAGARTVGGGYDARTLRRAFAHSLVPIALAYVAAHYLTFLLFQGQALKYLISDPLGHGWDLFGTADSAIDYGLVSQNMAWYLQVGFVVAGHVAALTLAHDRALVLYASPRQAVRSQYWMLGVMVGFTTLALWLLASANA
jgi:hypothetical protein